MKLITLAVFAMAPHKMPWLDDVRTPERSPASRKIGPPEHAAGSAQTRHDDRTSCAQCGGSAKTRSCAACRGIFPTASL